MCSIRSMSIVSFVSLPLSVCALTSDRKLKWDRENEMKYVWTEWNTEKRNFFFHALRPNDDHYRVANIHIRDEVMLVHGTLVKIIRHVILYFWLSCGSKWFSSRVLARTHARIWHLCRNRHLCVRARGQQPPLSLLWL